MSAIAFDNLGHEMNDHVVIKVHGVSALPSQTLHRFVRTPNQH